MDKIKYYFGSIDRRWRRELAEAKDRVMIFSPFITKKAETILADIEGSMCDIYTRFTVENFLKRGSSITTLRRLSERGFRIYHLEGLHAKVIFVPERFASIGSQNLTFFGTVNKEASVAFESEKQLSKIEKKLATWIGERLLVDEELIAELESALKPVKVALRELGEEVYNASVGLENLKVRKAQIRDAAQDLTTMIEENKSNLQAFLDSESVSELVSRRLIRASAWWLTHYSGFPVRAPGDADRIEKIGKNYYVTFGRNRFVVSWAILRSIFVINAFFEKLSKGESVVFDELRDEVSMQIRGAVATYQFGEYKRLYDVDYDNRMVFGAHAIDVTDFVDELFHMFDVEKVKELVEQTVDTK